MFIAMNATTMISRLQSNGCHDMSEQENFPSGPWVGLYRPFYVLLARMMRFCSCDQAAQVTYLLDEFGANLPEFLKRHMRWKEVAMYMRFHDISGIKKCLVILETQVPGTSSTERGSA